MKKVIVNIFILLSLFGFSFNYSNAEEEQDIDSIFGSIFGGIMDEENNTTQEEVQKTPRELAREALNYFNNGEKYVELIDKLIEKNKGNSVKLNRIYGKVSTFDFTKYHSSVPGKDATLAAVINYIKVSLEEVLNINTNNNV